MRLCDCPRLVVFVCSVCVCILVQCGCMYLPKKMSRTYGSHNVSGKMLGNTLCKTVNCQWLVCTLQLVCYSREVLHHKVLDGRVALSCGETLWIDPVEHRVTLKGENVS